MKLRTSGIVSYAIAAVVGLGMAGLSYASGLKSGWAWMALIVGALVGFVSLWMAVFGTEALVVDVPASMAHFRAVTKQGSVSLPLAELGELYIDVVKDTGNKSNAHKFDRYLLRARGIPKATLFDSLDRPEVDTRKTLIENLVSAATIRPLLAVVHGDGGAFRSVEVLPRARQLVADEARLRGALEVLAADHDASVRASAGELRKALRGAA